MALLRWEEVYMGNAKEVDGDLHCIFHKMKINQTIYICVCIYIKFQLI